MSGSRLGRGRGGRLAVYVGCGVVIILLVFLYRAATSEMARLRDLHIQCVHQHESLAAQLQVIFEYKVRLEKSLAEEKSSNAAVKQELQQRASREKSLRDKDSIEAMQRFNSLQQTYKILQTEHQDLQEECKKREKQVLEETNRLQSTLQDLHSRIRETNEEKEKIIGEKDRTLENFKNKYLELDTEKAKLEERYNDLMKSTGNTDSTIEHLRKEVIQLKRELDNEKKRYKLTSSETSLISPKQSQPGEQNVPDNTAIDPTQEERQQAQQQQQQQQQQNVQVSRPNNDDEMNSEPLPAPRNHHAIGDALLSNERNVQDEQDDVLPNQEQSNVRFAPEDDNIIPVGPNEVVVKDEERQKLLPLPYDLRDKRNKKVDDDGFPSAEDVVAKEESERKNTDVADDGLQDPQKQVLSPPKKSSSKEPIDLEHKILNHKSPNTDDTDTLARPDAQNNFPEFRDTDNEAALVDAWQQKEEIGN